MEHRNRHGLPFEVHSRGYTGGEEMEDDTMFAVDHKAEYRRRLRKGMWWLVLFLAVIIGASTLIFRPAGADEVPNVAVIGVPTVQTLLLCNTKEQVVRVTATTNSEDWWAEVEAINEEAQKVVCARLRQLIALTERHEVFDINFDGTDFTITIVKLDVLVQRGTMMLGFPQWSFVVLKVVTHEEYQQLLIESSWSEA